mmetsp:Transcript_3062/g.8355  ORF Transcript_3062/g.8355 Transcript_3062/m.8355 type:complete len:214 (-) Transcript_3062:295-936(-)
MYTFYNKKAPPSPNVPSCGVGCVQDVQLLVQLLLQLHGLLDGAPKSGNVVGQRLYSLDIFQSRLQRFPVVVHPLNRQLGHVAHILDLVVQAELLPGDQGRLSPVPFCQLIERRLKGPLDPHSRTAFLHGSHEVGDLGGVDIVHVIHTIVLLSFPPARGSLPLLHPLPQGTPPDVLSQLLEVLPLPSQDRLAYFYLLHFPQYRTLRALLPHLIR